MNPQELSFGLKAHTYASSPGTHYSNVSIQKTDSKYDAIYLLVQGTFLMQMPVQPPAESATRSEVKPNGGKNAGFQTFRKVKSRCRSNGEKV